MSGTIKMSGLASGIPFDELVAQMVDAEKYQARKLEQWRKSWEDKVSTLQDLASRVSALQSVNNSLRIASSFVSRIASSSDTRVADITVDSNASIGNFQLEVASGLAHKIGSTGFYDNSHLFSDGTLSFSVGGGANISIDVASDENISLDELASRINAQASGQVTATVETVGSVTRLVLTSNTTGQNGNITINSDTLGLSMNNKSTDPHFMTTENKNPVEYSPLKISGDYTGHISKTLNFTIEQSGTREVVKRDADNNRIPVYKVDDDGEFIQAEDEFGEPLYQTDGDGNFVLDDDGIKIPIWVQDTDASGNLKWETEHIPQSIRIRWFDHAEGKSGVVTIDANQNSVELFQGLTISVESLADRQGVINRQEFSLNVYSPDIQLGQDKGIAQSAQLESMDKWSSVTNVISTTDAKFSYSYAGNVHDINVPAGTSLERLVRLINDTPGNPGVRASVLNDGKGGFSLVLTGQDSGAANQIVILDTPNSVLNASDFHTNRQATNAIVKLDGSRDWVQRSSNLITDLVDGASIRIKDSGTTSFNITTDHEDMADKVQAFVDEYNAILDFIDEITRVVIDENGDADMQGGGILVGNYAVNMLRSALRGFIGGRAAGFSPDEDIFSLLTQIGLNSNHLTRRLDFDRDEFISQLSSNERDVVSLFSANSDATLNDNRFSILPGILGLDNYKSGNYRFNIEFDDVTGLISKVEMTDPSTNETYSSENTLPAGGREIRIAEDGLSFTINTGGARTMIIETAQSFVGQSDAGFILNVKDGKGKSFDEEINRLFDETSGITKVLEKNYENIISNINKRLEREYMRVLQVQNRLERRFANLEVMMGSWNGQMERLQAQIRQLPQGM